MNGDRGRSFMMKVNLLPFSIQPRSQFFIKMTSVNEIKTVSSLKITQRAVGFKSQCFASGMYLPDWRRSYYDSELWMCVRTWKTIAERAADRHNLQSALANSHTQQTKPRESLVCHRCCVLLLVHLQGLVTTIKITTETTDKYIYALSFARELLN